jgi:hypothetical protein
MMIEIRDVHRTGQTCPVLMQDRTKILFMSCPVKHQDRSGMQDRAEHDKIFVPCKFHTVIFLLKKILSFCKNVKKLKMNT